MRIFYITLLSLIVLSAPAHAGRLTGERSLSDTKWGYQIVTDPVRLGRKSQRFEVRAGDCGHNEGWDDCANNRERSEFRLKSGWRYGQTRWIGFSVFLPKDFKTSGKVNSTVGQIHQKGGPKGTADGLPSYPPLLQLEMRGNTYRAGVHILSRSASNVRDTVTYFDLAQISKMRGVWTDIVIHLDTSKGHEQLEVFINGTRKAQIQDFITFVPKSFYFKYGIYRSFVSRHGGAMPKQILYIDEVRMGPRSNKAVINEKRAVD